MTMKTTPTNF